MRLLQGGREALTQYERVVLALLVVTVTSFALAGILWIVPQFKRWRAEKERLRHLEELDQTRRRHEEEKEHEERARARAEQERRLHSAEALGRLVKKSQDWQDSLERLMARQGAPMGATTGAHWMVFFLAVVVRSIALEKDKIRTEDIDRLMAFVKAATEVSWDQEDGFRELVEFALKEWKPEDEGWLELPLVLLKECDSPDLARMHRGLIAFALDTAMYPVEVSQRRFEAYQTYVDRLSDAMRSESTQSGARTSGERSPYELFEVLPDCTNEELRQAYLRKVKALHPDRLQDLTPELRALAERELKVLNVAYEELARARR